jgi:hypothetical protein
VHLKFDPRALRADVERLPLEDAGLNREWGEALYRIRLASAQPLATGDFTISIAP